MAFAFWSVAFHPHLNPFDRLRACDFLRCVPNCALTLTLSQRERGYWERSPILARCQKTHALRTGSSPIEGEEIIRRFQAEI